MFRVVAAVVAVWASGVVLAAQSAGPRLSPRDQIKVTVWGGNVMVPELSRQFTIDAEGVLDFPWVETKVKAAGMTAHELAADLAGRLKSSGMIVNPQVSIDFEQTPNKKVMVTGAVLNQGPQLFAGEFRVLEALTKAGGPKPEASDEALLVRGDEQMTVNIRVLATGDLAGNLVLQDGDQLIVRKAQLVFISGEVRAPGAYNVDTGTKLRQALALAGGITEKGSNSKVQILRPTPGKDKDQEVKNVTLETEVKPGDTITVKRRTF